MVLSIAGSDPSGGAGIQADLKTFTAVGVYGGAVVTCITVQNTNGVQSILPLPPELVAEQIASVLDDMPVTHIKTGMIGNGAIAAAIGDVLSTFGGEVICDPVLLSSDGATLLEPDDLALFIGKIASKATMLTPNLPELKVLSGSPCENEEEIVSAAGQIFATLPGLRTLVVKGGHFKEASGSVTDFLFLRHPLPDHPPSMEAVSHCRIKTTNTHGTGCTFASALAAFHLLCGDDRKAFRRASFFLHRLLLQSTHSVLGRGHGPLLHHLYYPGVELPQDA